MGPGDYTAVAAGKNQPEELMRISHYLEPLVPRFPNACCQLAGQAPLATSFTRMSGS